MPDVPNAPDAPDAPDVEDTGGIFAAGDQPTAGQQPGGPHPLPTASAPAFPQDTPARQRGARRPVIHGGHSGRDGLDGREGQPQSRPTAPAPRASRQDGATWNGMPYHDYKAVRDRAYFQHLMDVCEGDVVRASQLSGLSIASVYRHLALAGIATRTRAKR